MLVSAHSSPVPKQTPVFPPWRIALTSCLPSQRMCHYTTRSDGQNQKKHNAVGLRHTSKVKVEVAQIHFQRGAITHVDEWSEISANDETKFILVMYGRPVGAVLFVRVSAQLNVHHFLCSFFFFLFI